MHASQRQKINKDAQIAASPSFLKRRDNDQDAYGASCSVAYTNYPWWYGACWDGNYFGGSGHQDGPYWSGSGGDYHNYGGIYIGGYI